MASGGGEDHGEYSGENYLMEKRPDLSAEIHKAWRLATAPWRAMPSWVLVGAPKCGTSTLYDYLVDHPDCRRGIRKEPTNFLHYPGSRLRSAMNFPIRYPGKFLVGDGSVEYFTHPDGPQNLHAVIPDARLIFVFRDPVERAWSDFRMFRKDGREREDFDVVVRRATAWVADPTLAPLIEAAAKQAYNPVRYVLCGMYARYLERWLEVFPREQCLFLMSEEFFADPVGTALIARKHVGLSEAPIRTLSIARDGGRRDDMPPSARECLSAFYTAENERLAFLLGRKLPWMRS